MSETFYLGEKYDWSDTSNAAIFIDIEDAGAQAIRIQEYVTGQTTPSFEIENNAGTTVFQVLASATTGNSLVLTPSVTTGNGLVLTANALTTGKGISVQTTGETLTSGILVDAGITFSGSLPAVTGNVAKFASSLTSTDTGGTATENYDTVLISRTAIANGAGHDMDADGAALKIETVATQTAGTLTEDSYAIEITHNVYSASDVAAIKITSDNAGAGNAVGIDLSSFAAGEGAIKFAAGTSAAANTDVANADEFVNVDVGGTIYALPLYVIA